MEGQDKGVKTYFRIHFSHKAAKPQRQVSGFVHRLHRFQRLALTRRRRGAGSQTESDRPAEEVCVSYSLQPTASRLGCNLRPSAMTPACAGQVCLRKSLLRASVPSCEDRRSSAFIGGCPSRGSCPVARGSADSRLRENDKNRIRVNPRRGSLLHDR